MNDTFCCVDPECQGHREGEGEDEDFSREYSNALPLGATMEQRTWADRMDGRQFGYPDCCIAAFITDVQAGRLPAMTRWAEVPGLHRCRTARPHWPKYVPCQKCARALVVEGQTNAD